MSPHEARARVTAVRRGRGVYIGQGPSHPDPDIMCTCVAGAALPGILQCYRAGGLTGSKR